MSCQGLAVIFLKVLLGILRFGGLDLFLALGINIRSEHRIAPSGPCGIYVLSSFTVNYVMTLPYHTIHFSQVETEVNSSVTSQDWGFSSGKVRIAERKLSA